MKSGEDVQNVIHTLRYLESDHWQVQDEDHCDNTGTRFLWFGLIADWQDDDLNFCFDDHLEIFITMRTSHRERGLGIENCIFEDEIGAVRTNSYIGWFLCGHSVFYSGDSDASPTSCWFFLATEEPQLETANIIYRFLVGPRPQKSSIMVVRLINNQQFRGRPLPVG